MKKLWFLALAVFCLGLTSMASDDGSVTLRASLQGTNEVPAINSNGTASFHATIQSNGTINFQVTFANLTSNAILSHIHFGKVHVAGGVMVWLCGGGGQAACPAASSGTFSGMITTANVTGPTAQGITAGDLASALRAIGQGAGYVNLHSVNFPGGELRGQVVVRGGDGDRDDR